MAHQFKNNFIYQGEPKPIKIVLHLRQNHFDVVKSLTASFNKDYFCMSCLRPYQNRNTHSCEKHCIVCKKDDCEVTADKMSCHDCHMKFRSIDCFNAPKNPHITYIKRKLDAQTPIPCESFWRCTTCMHVIHLTQRRPSEHICGEYLCKMCSNFVMPDH